MARAIPAGQLWELMGKTNKRLLRRLFVLPMAETESFQMHNSRSLQIMENNLYR